MIICDICSAYCTILYIIILPARTLSPKLARKLLRIRETPEVAAVVVLWQEYTTYLRPGVQGYSYTLLYCKCVYINGTDLLLFPLPWPAAKIRCGQLVFVFTLTLCVCSTVNARMPESNILYNVWVCSCSCSCVHVPSGVARSGGGGGDGALCAVLQSGPVLLRRLARLRAGERVRRGAPDTLTYIYTQL